MESQISIQLDKNYDSFKEFYDENMFEIYKSVVNLFEFVSEKKDKKYTLHIDAKINDLEWGTDLTYGKENSEILIRVLLPIFENVEDFETCIKIRDLYNKITRD
jgi:hypothetical protein